MNFLRRRRADTCPQKPMTNDKKYLQKNLLNIRWAKVNSRLVHLVGNYIIPSYDGKTGTIKLKDAEKIIKKI